MRVLPYGDTALLVELEGLRDVLALYTSLSEDPCAGLVDLVPAERTVLVRFDQERTSVDAVTGWVRSARAAPRRTAPAPAVRIPVTYDGEDLESTAQALGWSIEDLVTRHSRRAWRVGFVGFAPGFGYLVPDGEWPIVARRDDPRTAVPAGSVALAGTYSGIYPRASPGGWQLIGRTEVDLWDPHRDPPALLVPGVEVRFEVVS